ncbi:MAG: HAD family hydrolase [Phycisphaeraceae bacterium]
MLKAIVFDFDGVLVDSEPLHFEAFLEVLRPLGVTFDYRQYLLEFIGFDDRDAFAHILDGTEAGADDDRAGRIAELCAHKQTAFERLVKRGIEPIPGAMPLVDAAAQCMPIAIASGATMSDITLILDQLGRRDVFEVIVSADQVERSKPDPTSYALAVERLAALHPERALTPADCLAIEDTAAGLASARLAGLHTLGVATTGTPNQLADAERTVETLTEVTLADLEAWFGLGVE